MAINDYFNAFKKKNPEPEPMLTPATFIPPFSHRSYGSSISSSSLHPTGSSAYYEAMAEHARIVERNTAMIKLADKLGLKSAEDVENLIKEIGLE